MQAKNLNQKGKTKVCMWRALGEKKIGKKKNQIPVPGTKRSKGGKKGDVDWPVEQIVAACWDDSIDTTAGEGVPVNQGGSA